MGVKVRPADFNTRQRWTLRAFIVLVLGLFAFHAPNAESAVLAQPTTRPVGQQDMTLIRDEDIHDLELLNLEVPMVVTASRREQRITAVPYAVSVITSEDIRAGGARSVPDALRLAAGVDVAQLASADAAVSPRGFQGWLSGQTLVLVDGRQIYDSFFGGTLWCAWPFQLEDIERIEVIRGPGGVTWGANAVNGIINVITKDPRDQQGLLVTGGGGSQGWFKEHTGYGFVDDKLRVRVSGEYQASDGFPHGGSWLKSLDDEYKHGNMGVHAIYEAGPHDTLLLSGGSALIDGGAPATPLEGIGLSHNSGAQTAFLLSKWTHRVSPDNAVELTGFVNDFHGCPGIPAVDYRYDQIALQLSHSFKPVESHTLTWGIDTRTDLLDAGNADPYMLSRSHVSNAIIGAYVEDEWRFAPRWSLNLGSRLDYDFYGGFQPSGRASLSYDLTDQSMIYGAVSRAFHMPVAASRFLELPLVNGLAVVKGHRSVEPVTLIAYELGYRSRFFDRLDTDINLFWHDYDNQTTISPTLGPPGLIRMDFDNRASAAMYGLEFDAKYAVTSRLSLIGNYTYQQLDWSGSSPYSDKDLITPPKHKFMIGARYNPVDALHLSGHLYYVDDVRAPDPGNPLIPRRVPQYFRLDLRAEYEFWKKRASVAVGVRNLLDKSHYEGSDLFINSAEVPRMIYAEMRVAFDPVRRK